jgi:hypothetical protein
MARQPHPRRRHATLIGGAAVAGLLAAGCHTTTPPPDKQTSPPAASQSATSPGAPTTSAGGPTNAPARTPRCGSNDLSGAFAFAPGSAGAGTVVYTIRLTNTTTHACTLFGHPGLLLLGASNTPLPTHVQWNSMVATTRVTLAPHRSASASARFSPHNPGPGDAQSGNCQPTAARIKITPPDEKTQLVATVTPPTSVCERGALSVSALVPGAAGPGQS